MKKSKRFFAFILIAVMALGLLTACGAGSGPQAAPQASGTAPVSTGSTNSASAAIRFTVTADVTGDRAPYVERFAQLVEEKTDGRYVADVIAAASLGTGADAAQMLQMGTLDILMSDDMTMDGVLNGALGFAWLPGLVSDYEEADQYYNFGWIADKVSEIMAENDLIRISSYCNGFRQVGNIKRPVTEMSELAGLKIRTPSVESVVRFYELCGALPVMISGAEVLNALQTGTVDGLDNAVFNYTNQGITDVITHITEINYCYSGGCFLASPSFWNTLSEEDQVIFRECAQAASDEFTTFFREKTEALTEAGVESGQWTVDQPSDDMKAAMQDIFRQIWDESRSKYGDEIMDIITSGEYKTLSSR